MTQPEELLPPGEIIPTLPVHLLAGHLVQYFRAWQLHQRHSIMSRAYLGKRNWLVRVAGKPRVEEVGNAIMEAFSWLERHGLIAPHPHAVATYQSAPCYFLTAAADEIQSPGDIEELQRRYRLQQTLLHPRIAERAWEDFISGEYAKSVFSAFREIEVAVREASGLSNSFLGRKLMSEAFRKGPLRDQDEEAGEAESLVSLFEGAIGRFKNPSSHRHVELDSPEETYEMLAFASLLMRIVDMRHAMRLDRENGA